MTGQDQREINLRRGVAIILRFWFLAFAGTGNCVAT